MLFLALLSQLKLIGLYVALYDRSEMLARDGKQIISEECYLEL